MTYEVGQKVETPLGVGIIYTTQNIEGLVVYKVEFEKTKLNFLATFVEGELKPYKTPHERLVELGFEIHNGKHTKSIISDSGYHILIHNKSKEIGILGKALTFDLWKIFAEYLEWLGEEK